MCVVLSLLSARACSSCRFRWRCIDGPSVAFIIVAVVVGLVVLLIVGVIAVMIYRRRREAANHYRRVQVWLLQSERRPGGGERWIFRVKRMIGGGPVRWMQWSLFLLCVPVMRCGNRDVLFGCSVSCFSACDGGRHSSLESWGVCCCCC